MVSPKLNNKTRIIVLQHPSEVSVTKNTVRLLTLQLTSVEVYVGEKPSDFTVAQQIAKTHHCGLLYPDQNAIAVESMVSNSQTIDTLFVLDGTWKKANKIAMLNPWLNHLKKITFSALPENKYAIRKAEQSYSLSTLEACAYFLECYEKLSAEPLHHLLTGMIHEQTKFMPEDVKKRYFHEDD
ncbi:hypothetical protein N481_05885 [Pseudoalteromonas luteoviolacea S4047-1]|uniref:tRNA-uridine aminocarboxypropyltransferase n=1 Tax=Pseudoalteromonas luteoviolacea S4054 TaxID=1129367 RepID=A0A0F6ABC4_9GAMM|nr:hypothetical protein N479_13790 [Pseudoalteromonas luteoviolacea S4054]KZN75875.1 hypothetical protein N481_05885 [Pseudoalteromonas luteoviolacea S4047-1]